MTKHKQKEADKAALEILRSTGADVLEAALVAKMAMEVARGKVKRALKCIDAGAEVLRQQERTVTFEKAVEAALAARKDRRTRTVYDFRYFTRRFMKRCKGLAARRVRAMTPQEIEQITTTAEKYQDGSCAAAVGMMLYAGIRPHEVARLTWAQVDLREESIYILPQHSKTGGARRVTIHRPLLRILRKRKGEDNELICPANWLRHWRELRRVAGWGGDRKWPQDALRHTFASYHLSHFRSFSELQLEIGHRDATLLRTRYVDQRGVQGAAGFWAA